MPTRWQRLVTGELGTFHRAFFVSFHEFESGWSSWEKHLNGDEVGFLLSGAVTLVFEDENGPEETELNEAGALVIIPKGTWHTAKIYAPSRMLFISYTRDELVATWR